MEEITVMDLGRVLKSEYVKAKTKDLIEFGFRGLSESEVSYQVDLILDGQAPTSVIGHFCKKDIIIGE